MKRHLLLTYCLAIGTWICAAPMARAQAPDAPAAAPAPATVQKTEVPDPAVDFIVKSNPTTPAELFYAVKSLDALGRPDLAAPLMKKLIELKPDEATLADLVNEYGGAAFMRLATKKEFGPDAAQFVREAMEAAAKQARDPERLAALIEQLKAPEVRKRLEAIVQLKLGREAAAAALIAVLADADRADEHPQIRAALPALGADALGPLIGALQAEDVNLRASVCEVLGDLEEQRAVPYLQVPALSAQSPDEVRTAARAALVKLVRRVPTFSDAAANMYTTARPLYENPSAASPNAIARWNYDTQMKQVALEELPPEVNALATAADLAGGARELLPDEINIRRLYLASLLEAASYREGLDKPLPNDRGSEAADVGAEGVAAVEDLLEHAVRTDHPVAAAAAARILGDSNQPGVLYRGTAQGRPSVLARAAQHKNRRVRFAAVEAILKLKPADPFPGSSAVTNSLAFFAGSIGAPRAIVADVRASEASRLAGLLMEIGYEADVATDARTVLSLAIRAPDYELILLDMTLAEPTSGELIQRLRRDSRTATVPIGLVCDSDALGRAEILSRRETLTSPIIRPADPIIEDLQQVAFFYSEKYKFIDRGRKTGLTTFLTPWNVNQPAPTARDGLEFQTGQLLSRAGQSAVSLAERHEQAARALEWLAELSSRPGGFYDLRRVEEAAGAALSMGDLSENAGRVLANLGTNRGQRALVDRASRATLPLAARQAAAKSFEDSVKRHGTLLTTGEVLQQYDRYNQSAVLDKETQAVLASILDTIEARAKKSQAAVSRTSVPQEKTAP